METLGKGLVEFGVAHFILPGESECGDRHFLCRTRGGFLIAAIDGIGHGIEAAAAANMVAFILKRHADEPLTSLAEYCHEKLKSTRGAVLSAAAIDASQGVMTWLGVGNVRGVLLRGSAGMGVQEQLLLRGGIVGSQLPYLQAAVLPVSKDDTLIFATDGIREDFLWDLSVLENPRRAANRILETYRTGNDDALVLVARLIGVTA